MRPLLIGVLLAVGLAPQLLGRAQEPAPVQTPAPVPPSVKVTFEPNGLVSLTATNISVREILAEWTRKGGTIFQGHDRLPAAPLTLQYDHRPEIEVMNSLLRGASGVVMAPRDQMSADGASALGIVFVTATSSPSSSSYTTPAYTPQQPQFSTQGNPDQEIQPAAPGRGAEPPQPSSAPPPAPRPAGVSPVAVQVVPVQSAGSTNPTPTPTPTPSGPGRGGR